MYRDGLRYDFKAEWETLQCDEGVQHRYEAQLYLRAGDPSTGLVPALVQAVQLPVAQHGSVPRKHHCLLKW